MKCLRQRLIWATLLAIGVIAVSSVASAQGTGVIRGQVIAVGLVVALAVLFRLETVEVERGTSRCS